jgi:hypothetical protein
MKLRKGAVVALAAVAAPAAFFGAQAVAGSGTPANKVVAAGSKRVVIAAQQTETIMTGTMRTSKPTDIMIHTGLECSIFTKLLTNNTDNSATAGARARVWVEVDGKIVSLTQNSQPPQNDTVPSSGNDSDKVTFCDREYSRTVTDGEGDLPPTAIDQQDDYIRTKSAHGFNWVRMNMGSGIHTIAVKAQLTTNTDGQATATLEIGNRTLIVEPTHMANDAVIQEAGSY